MKIKKSFVSVCLVGAAIFLAALLVVSPAQSLAVAERTLRVAKAETGRDRPA